MKNRFEAAMAKHKDKELLRIVSVFRNDYDPLAVEAAEAEIRKRNLDPAFVEATQVLLEEEFRNQVQVEAKNEIQFFRAVHLFVDTFLYYLLGFALAIGGMYVVPYGPKSEAEMLGQLFIVMVFVAFFLYYLGMELAFGRTVAKFITGTKVAMKDGSKPNFEAILKRTACRLIPLDAISFLLTKNGFHDRFSDTMVVKKNEPFTSSANAPESSSPVI